MSWTSCRGNLGPRYCCKSYVTERTLIEKCVSGASRRTLVVHEEPKCQNPAKDYSFNCLDFRMLREFAQWSKVRGHFRPGCPAAAHRSHRAGPWTHCSAVKCAAQCESRGLISLRSASAGRSCGPHRRAGSLGTHHRMCFLTGQSPL